MGPVLLSYASDSGAARIVNGGPKRGNETTKRGGGGRVCMRGEGREIFANSCLKTAFSCELLLLVNYVKWHKSIPTPPLKSFVYSNQGGGAWALVPSIYASDSGAVRICCRGGGAKRGGEATRRGECVGGPAFSRGPPTVGRFVKVSA